MDDYRFRAQQSPRNEAPMNSIVSPPRNGARVPQPLSAHDLRTTLPRRFTTDSGRIPTLSTISSQRPPEPQDYTTATQYKAQLFEKKKFEYERLLEQKRRFDAEMENHENELVNMQQEIRGAGLGLTGHQSEPTTPPEYRDTTAGFPTMLSRPNRYSMSSLASPPGYNRPRRSGSQLASPQSGIMPQRFAYDDQLPARSVPGSRRNSDEDEKEEALRQDPTSHRSTNALNRYSMPVTRRGNLYDNIDQTNAAGFLFRDDESNMDNYAGVEVDDGFPKLFASKNNPNRLSASAVAADLAAMGAAEASNGWNKMPLHRAQQSLSALPAPQMNSADVVGGQPGQSSDVKNIGSRNFRHSLDLKQAGAALDMSAYLPKETVQNPQSSQDSAANIMSPPSGQAQAAPPKLQTSFSANDIPTVKNVTASNMASLASLNANAHAQQHFHNHNASMGRIPPGAVKRHSRELSSESHGGLTQSATFPSIGSALHANAPSFGPVAGQQLSHGNMNAPPISSPGSISSISSYPSYYGGYNPSTPNGANGTNYAPLAVAMSQMSLNGGGYSPASYTGYSPSYQQNGHARDSQQRVMQQRRSQDNEGMNRFKNVPLESFGGSIFDLCKDQNGCRYLQEQLDSRNPEHIHMIWVETNTHVVELMTDPFGNYLCQKLLECCNDDERTALIKNASSDMVRIALNQHGTRALQKMIEFISIPEHVGLIIEALRYQVVDLIQDLNGNHVIQKCLAKLDSEHLQFIFDAVGNRCVDVGTHRHGCCVLQRCIDHASGQQKVWLIRKITEHAYRLVQDPFGNYVVQYIIDLNEPSFTEPLVNMFGGKMASLSRHKFSSNVMEKCLRCASDSSRDMLASELLAPGEMHRLLKDSFGNYVVQTALEHSTYHMKRQLIEAIRPVLPEVRTTPYGRRLQAKVQAYDSQTGPNTGQTTPADSTQGQLSSRSPQNRSMPNNASILAAQGYNGTNGRNPAGYAQGANLTAPPPPAPRFQQSYTFPGAGIQPGNGEGQFF